MRTLQSKQDGQDRVLVSFEQAKMSLMEWSIEEFDLIPVSLHTFEKLPQVVRPFLHLAQHLSLLCLFDEAHVQAEDRPTLIAHDPNSRMTVLHLPTNSGGDGTLAILPWFTEELDLEGLGMDRQGWEQGGSQ